MENKKTNKISTEKMAGIAIFSALAFVVSLVVRFPVQFLTFDAKDAFGMRMAAMKGYHLAAITGGRSLSIVKRLHVCGFKEDDIYLGSRIKINDFEDFCRKHDLKPEEVMYFGDDLPDIPVLPG